MPSLNDIGLYWRTLRPLRWQQWYWRARYRVEAWLDLRRAPCPDRQPPWDGGAAGRLREFAQLLAQAAPPVPERVAELRSGSFTYVNRTVNTGGYPPWEEEGQPRLWQYHAHYGEELLLLALHYVQTPAEADRERAAAWLEAWIDRHPPPAGVAWEAYPVAARLLNWSVAAAVFEFGGDRLRRSILQQAHYLARYAEYDIQANHLLRNAAALVCAGALVDDCLLAKGLVLLRQQVAEQILDDGGHYERSPMYHAQVLQDCLVAWVAVADKPDWLTEAISRMIAFCHHVRLGDGEFPFFNDCVLGQTLPCEALLALARGVSRIPAPDPGPAILAWPHSGFYVMGPADLSGRLIARAGPPGPAYQLGHAHCDALSFELSLGVQRVLVNSGVHDYELGDWRSYGRSTRAHNTVQVAGREQLEAWSIFRTGRRYRCRVHLWERHGAAQMLCASHDGFAPYGHQRSVRFLADEGYWVISDQVEGPGVFDASSYIHCHPACSVEMTADGALIHWKTGKLRVVVAGADHMECVIGEEAPRQGWYSPQFYTAVAGPVLVLHKTVTRRAGFGYALVPEHREPPSVAMLLQQFPLSSLPL
jgi:uncharacterized heparinase superfamily protein